MPDQLPQDQLSEPRILRLVSTEEVEEADDFGVVWYLILSIVAGVLALIFTQCQSWWGGFWCMGAASVGVYLFLAALARWHRNAPSIEVFDEDFEDDDVDPALAAQAQAFFDGHNNIQQ